MLVEVISNYHDRNFRDYFVFYAPGNDINSAAESQALGCWINSNIIYWLEPKLKKEYLEN